MSAVRGTDQRNGGDFPHFAVPWCDHDGEQLLLHFRQRRRIRYFPAAEECAPEEPSAAALLYDRFEFDGVTHQLETGFDWQVRPDVDSEWLHQLHRFHYGVTLGRAFLQSGDERYRDKWVELTASWIARFAGRPAPAETLADRLQNWIYAYRYFLSGPGSLEAAFHADLLAAIHGQASQLREILDSVRDDRLADLHALFLAAVVFPEFRDSAGWIGFSVEELCRRLRRQVESGLTYWSFRSRRLLDQALAVRHLALLNGIEVPAEMDRMIREVLDFNLQLLRPDGQLPVLTDDDCSEWVDPFRQASELYGGPALLYVATRGKQGKAPPYRPELAGRFGYGVLRSGWGSAARSYAQELYLVLDCACQLYGEDRRCAPLGLEVSAYGSLLLLNPAAAADFAMAPGGCQGAVAVDRRLQAVVASARRPRAAAGPIQGLRAAEHRLGFGYLHGIAIHPACPVIHERKILFVAGEYWLICDLLRGEDLHEYELQLPLHPDALGRVQADAGAGRVESPHLLILQAPATAASLVITEAAVCLGSAMRRPAPLLRFSQRAACCCFYTVLYPFADAPPDIALELLPVCDELGYPEPADRALGLAIVQHRAGGACRDEVFVSHRPCRSIRYGEERVVSPYLVQRFDAAGRPLFRHGTSEIV